MTTRKRSISTGCSTQMTTKTPYAGMRGVTRIHVNQHSIRRNKKRGTELPVITVKKGKRNVYGHEVLVDGPSAVIYSPDNPLSCGARVWIETVSTVRVIERDSSSGIDKTIELEGKMVDVNEELTALEASLSDEVIVAQEEHSPAPLPGLEKETPAQRKARWVKYGREHLKGRKIKDVRYMETDEVNGLGWSCGAIVIELDNGTLLYPSCDDEGNNAGALFGNTPNESLTFPVLWR